MSVNQKPMLDPQQIMREIDELLTALEPLERFVGKTTLYDGMAFPDDAVTAYYEKHHERIQHLAGRLESIGLWLDDAFTNRRYPRKA